MYDEYIQEANELNRQIEDLNRRKEELLKPVLASAYEETATVEYIDSLIRDVDDHVSKCFLMDARRQAEKRGTQDFDTALAAFLEGSQQIINIYFAKNFPNVHVPTLVISKGRRYVKIIQQENVGRSAWGFVDIRNGDILKAASWAAPAKHARGNIFDIHKGLKHIGPHGPAYLR